MEDGNTNTMSFKRTSILKPPRERIPLQPVNTTELDDDMTATATAVRLRRVSFGITNHIKEFQDQAAANQFTTEYEQEFLVSSDSSHTFSTSMNSHMSIDKSFIGNDSSTSETDESLSGPMNLIMCKALEDKENVQPQNSPINLSRCEKLPQRKIDTSLKAPKADLQKSEIFDFVKSMCENSSSDMTAVIIQTKGHNKSQNLRNKGYSDDIENMSNMSMVSNTDTTLLFQNKNRKSLSKKLDTSMDEDSQNDDNDNYMGTTNFKRMFNKSCFNPEKSMQSFCKVDCNMDLSEDSLMDNINNPLEKTTIMDYDMDLTEDSIVKNINNPLEKTAIMDYDMDLTEDCPIKNIQNPLEKATDNMDTTESMIENVPNSPETKSFYKVDCEMDVVDKTMVENLENPLDTNNSDEMSCTNIVPKRFEMDEQEPTVHFSNNKSAISFGADLKLSELNVTSDSDTSKESILNFSVKSVPDDLETSFEMDTQKIIRGLEQSSTHNDNDENNMSELSETQDIICSMEQSNILNNKSLLQNSEVETSLNITDEQINEKKINTASNQDDCSSKDISHEITELGDDEVVHENAEGDEEEPSHGSVDEKLNTDCKTPAESTVNMLEVITSLEVVSTNLMGLTKPSHNSIVSENSILDEETLEEDNGPNEHVRVATEITSTIEQTPKENLPESIKENQVSNLEKINSVLKPPTFVQHSNTFVIPQASADTYILENTPMKADSEHFKTGDTFVVNDKIKGDGGKKRTTPEEFEGRKTKIGKILDTDTISQIKGDNNNDSIDETRRDTHHNTFSLTVQIPNMKPPRVTDSVMNTVDINSMLNFFNDETEASGFKSVRMDPLPGLSSEEDDCNNVNECESDEKMDIVEHSGDMETNKESSDRVTETEVGKSKLEIILETSTSTNDEHKAEVGAGKVENILESSISTNNKDDQKEEIEVSKLENVLESSISTNDKDDKKLEERKQEQSSMNISEISQENNTETNNVSLQASKSVEHIEKTPDNTSNESKMVVDEKFLTPTEKSKNNMTNSFVQDHKNQSRVNAKLVVQKLTEATVDSGSDTSAITLQDDFSFSRVVYSSTRNDINAQIQRFKKRDDYVIDLLKVYSVERDDFKIINLASSDKWKFGFEFFQQNIYVEFDLEKRSVMEKNSCSLILAHRISYEMTVKHQSWLEEIMFDKSVEHLKIHNTFSSFQDLTTVECLPDILKETTEYLSEVNSAVKELMCVLKYYPTSTFDNNILKFNLMSFPLRFSWFISVDLSKLLTLNKTSLTFEKQLGSLDTDAFTHIFLHTLNSGEYLVKFIQECVKYIITLEELAGDLVTRRDHIRLLKL